MTEREEKKNKYIALMATLGIHGALLLAFLLIMAWRAPNPPLPEYGIELNFGLDQQGSGDIQPEDPVGVQELQEEPQPEETTPETKEEVKEVKEASPEVVTNKQESPVVVKEEKKEPVKEVKKDPVKEVKTDPVVKEDTKVTKPQTTTGTPNPSQGDDTNKAGDKGNPEGKLDAKALYGKQGGGGGDGFDLSMSGWGWAKAPQIPKLPDNEEGRIVFEIECDADGEIIGVTTLERGLSPKAEQLLKEEIRNSSLYRTSGGKIPERSKGRVAFLLKAK